MQFCAGWYKVKWCTFLKYVRLAYSIEHGTLKPNGKRLTFSFFASKLSNGLKRAFANDFHLKPMFVVSVCAQRRYNRDLVDHFLLKWPPSARLAQSIEHETLTLRVVGSSPTLGVQLFPSATTLFFASKGMGWIPTEMIFWSFFYGCLFVHAFFRRNCSPVNYLRLKIL